MGYSRHKGKGQSDSASRKSKSSSSSKKSSSSGSSSWASSVTGKFVAKTQAAQKKAAESGKKSRRGGRRSKTDFSDTPTGKFVSKQQAAQKEASEQTSAASRSSGGGRTRSPGAAMDMTQQFVAKQQAAQMVAAAHDTRRATGAGAGSRGTVGTHLPPVSGRIHAERTPSIPMTQPHTRAMEGKSSYEVAMQRIGQGGEREAKEYTKTRKEYERALSGEDRLSTSEIKRLGVRMEKEYSEYETARGEAPKISAGKKEQKETWAAKSREAADTVRAFELHPTDFDTESATSGTATHGSLKGMFAPKQKPVSKAKTGFDYLREGVAQNIEMFGSAPTTLKYGAEIARKDPGIVPALGVAAFGGMVKGAKEDPLQTLVTMGITAGATKGISSAARSVHAPGAIKLPTYKPTHGAITKPRAAKFELPDVAGAKTVGGRVKASGLDVSGGGMDLITGGETMKAFRSITAGEKAMRKTHVDPETIMGGKSVTGRVTKYQRDRAALSEFKAAGIEGHARTIGDYGVTQRKGTKGTPKEQIVAAGLKEYGKVPDTSLTAMLKGVKTDAPSTRAQIVKAGLKEHGAAIDPSLTRMLGEFDVAKPTPRQQIVARGIKAHGKVLTPEETRLASMSSIERMIGIEPEPVVYGEAVIRQATRRPEYAQSTAMTVSKRQSAIAILAAFGEPMLRKAPKAQRAAKPVKVMERQARVKVAAEPAKYGKADVFGYDTFGMKPEPIRGAVKIGTRTRTRTRTKTTPAPFGAIAPMSYGGEMPAHGREPGREMRPAEFAISVPKPGKRPAQEKAPKPTESFAVLDEPMTQPLPQPETRTQTKTKTKTKEPPIDPIGGAFPKTPLPIVPPAVFGMPTFGKDKLKKHRPKKRVRKGVKFEEITNPITAIEDFL